MTEKVSIPKLEDTISQALDLWNVPGAGVSILHEGELVSARGYGVKTLGKTGPAGAQTNFAIGSNTKAFTAASIGILVEEGRLHWDDKVVQYLPDFAVYDPWVTQNVTIRDILSHRVGVSDVERMLYDATLSNTEVIRRLRFTAPQAPFRAGFVYSNISVMAAGEIIRVVTGQDWESFVHERLLEPLGMTRTTTNFLDVLQLEDVASPHASRYTGMLSMQARMLDPVEPIPWYDFGSQAAGGITSTVTDMARWLGLFLGNGTYEGKKILSPETVAAMTSPNNIIHTPSGSMIALKMLNAEINFWCYGLGWFVFDYKGRKLVFHGGQVQGMISFCGFIPQEHLGFTILTNKNLSLFPGAIAYTICDAYLGGSQRDWSRELFGVLQHIRKEEEERVRQKEETRQPGSHPALPLEAYTGAYDHAYFGNHTVCLEDGHLTLRFPPNLVGDLEHWQGEEFLIHWRMDPFETGALTFTGAKNGRVDGFTIENEGAFIKIGEANHG